MTALGAGYGAYRINEYVGFFFFGLGALIFLWSLYEFYRVHTAPVLPQRLTITAIRDKAARQGWTFEDPSLQIIDLTNALRQAGMDGALKFWGRPITGPFDKLVRDEPLILLEPAIWRTHQFSYGMLGELEDNFYCRITDPINQNAMKYGDIHVEKVTGLRWLKMDAAKERGKKKEN